MVTQFKTVNIIFILALIACIYFVKRNIQNIEVTKSELDSFSVNTLLSIILISVIFVFFYTLNFLRVVRFSEFLHFGSPFQDVNFYADCADALNLYGQENYLQTQNITSQFHGTEPYHYFDLWIVAFARDIFKKNSVYPQCLFILPFFQTILCIGYFSIFEKSSIINFFQAILLTFVCGYAPEILKVIPHFHGILAYNFFASSAIHIAIYFLFFLAAYIFKENEKVTILILSMLGIATPIAIPAIFGGIYLLLFTNFVKSKSLNNVKRLLESIAIPIIIGILFLLFYFYTSVQFQGSALKISELNLFAQEVKSSLKTFIGFHIVTFIPLVVLLLFSAHTVFQNKELCKEVILIRLFPFMLLCGSVGYAFFFNVYDGFQLMKQPINASICCIAVICYIRIYNSTKNVNIKNIFPLILFIILCEYHFVQYITRSLDEFTIDNAFLIKVKRELDNERNDFNIGIICDPQQPEFKLRLHRHGYLKYTDHCKGIMYLNNASNVKLEPVDKQAYLNRSFYAQQVHQIHIKDENAFRIKFMKKNNIKFLLVEDSSFIPDSSFLLIAEDYRNKFRLFKLI